MEKNKIFIINKTKQKFYFNSLLKKLYLKILKELNILISSEVNVIIINEKSMKDLSNKYRKINKVTDVLSFPNDWKKIKKLVNKNILGDIFICKSIIDKQAKIFNHSIKREIAYIFLHGLLHLFGYDHNNEKNERKMHHLIEKILIPFKIYK